MRRSGQPAESVVLPLDWSQSSVNATLQLIGRIYKLVVSKQETLKGALAITLGKSDTMAPAADWEAIATSLQRALQDGRNEIRDQTLENQLRPLHRGSATPARGAQASHRWP